MKILKARETYVHNYQKQIHEKGQMFLGKRNNSDDQTQGQAKNDREKQQVNNKARDAPIAAKAVSNAIPKPVKPKFDEQFSKPVQSEEISEQSVKNLNSVDRFWDKESLLAHVQKS